MTLRRAPASARRFRQMLAASRAHGCSAALLLGGLLLSPAAAPAGMHPTHPHHAPTESAGKAPAHTVHDTNTRTAHIPDKSPSRKGDRSAAAPRRPAPAPRHAGQPGHHEDPKARTSRKHHPELPVDEPMPMHRAQADRKNHGAQTQFAEKASGYGAPFASTKAYASERPSSRRASRPEPVSPVESAGANSGLTENDFVRTSRRAILAANTGASARSALAMQQAQNAQAFTSPRNAPAAVFATGFSHPDDDERLPMRGAEAAPAPPATRTQRLLALAKAAPAPAQIGAASSQTAPSTEVVEGFGAELDFHTPATRPANSVAIVLPHESPAQQERDLRAAADIAAQPMFVPLYARDGKLMVPPPLKGSHDILVHQNQMADDAGLIRIQDDDDLARLRRAKLLVDFPESASLHINEALPENRRSARPWTVLFATDAGRAFYARFGEPLQVNSAVRTVAYQLRLQRTNGNAAATEGEGASPHLTGQALDFGKRGMSLAEIAWMRTYLMPLIDAGKIDVEEEFQQACFHVSVYASYMPSPRQHTGPKTEVAQVTKATHTHTAGPEVDDNLR